MISKHWLIAAVLSATIIAIPCAALAEDAATDALSANDADKLGWREEIQRGLDKRVFLDVTDVPLATVLDDLARQAEITILVDDRSLEDIGLDAGTLKVTQRIEGVSLRAALPLLLRDFDCTFRVQNGAVVVGAHGVHCGLERRVFDVAQLTAVERDGRITHDHDPLIELLATIVTPEYWDGDRGSINGYAGRLVIEHDGELVERFHLLLSAMQRACELSAKAGNNNAETVVVDLDPQADTIRRALDKRLDFVFEETPLSDVVAQLESQLDINVELDEAELEEMGLEPAAPINFKAKSMKVRHALSHILPELGLTWFIGHESLLITLPYCFESMTRVYPIGDLLSGNRDAAALTGEWSLLNFDALETLITGSITPSHWAAVGGSGEIAFLKQRQLIVVRNSHYAHQEIEDLLKELRRASRASDDTSAQAPRPRMVVYAMPSHAREDGTAGSDGESADKAHQRLVLPPIDSETFLTVAKETIAPDTWSEPEVYARALPGRLVVRHHDAVHGQLRRLAAKLGLKHFRVLDD